MNIYTRFLTTSVLVLFQLSLSSNSTSGADYKQPNIIILFADDMGYGDLGCFGHPTIRTPNLDQMAAEGMKLTQFYAASSSCTPSRAALLTGRLPIRSGMTSNNTRVLFPDSEGGLPESEITIAEALKDSGYRTACIGKWHLGHLPKYLPTNNGFDYFFGLPYSNDMNSKARGYPPIPLIENLKTIEQPAKQDTLTQRYTEKAISFINKESSKPFFLYLPYTFPHVPLFASKKFLGTSSRGLYGDVVEEIDWSVGEILKTLKEKGIQDNTLVVFTSDNGPWLPQKLKGGSAGLLRGGKGSTWEGGMREPTIAWWPGKIKPNTVSQALGSTMDLFTTSLLIAGTEVPQDRIIDGKDLRPVLFSKGNSLRESLYYYCGQRLMALRKGPWKMHLIIQESTGNRKFITQNPPLLYQLEWDPGETVNVAEEHPEIIEELLDLMKGHDENMVIAKSQLAPPLSNLFKDLINPFRRPSYPRSNYIRLFIAVTLLFLMVLLFSYFRKRKIKKNINS